MVSSYECDSGADKLKAVGWACPATNAFVTVRRYADSPCPPRPRPSQLAGNQRPGALRPRRRLVPKLQAPASGNRAMPSGWPLVRSRAPNLAQRTRASCAMARSDRRDGNAQPPARRGLCAHLDHEPANNRMRNLRGLCQRCHLLHDRTHHAMQRWMTYRARYALEDLFLGEYFSPCAASQ